MIDFDKKKKDLVWKSHDVILWYNYKDLRH